MAKNNHTNQIQNNKSSNFLLNDTCFNIGNKSLQFSSEEKISLFLLSLLLILVFYIRSKFQYMPFERDEGIYSYFGTLILDGKIPYKDFYEVKFPGLFYFYALIVSVFGETVKGMHTGFMYVNILSIIFIYFASKKLFSPIAGIISATTFAFVSLTANLSGFTVQSEHGVAFFASLGLYFYALCNETKKWYYFLCFGVAMGLAFMVKTSGVFYALWGGLIVILDFMFSKKPKYFKQFIFQLLLYAFGGLFTIGVFFIIIFSKGSFNEMIYWTYEHTKTYVGGMPFEEGIKYFKYTRDAIIQNHKLFWFHSFLALIVCFLRPVDIKLKALGFTIIAFSMLTIVPGFYFYGHYWIQTVPGVSILAGLTFYSINKTFNNKIRLGKIKLKYIYLIVFAFLTIKHINALKQYYFKPNYELILRQVYGNNPFPEAMEIGNWINQNSNPEDNIVLIGSEPQIYFYTKKKSPSRHAYFTSVVNNVPMHKEWQREFARDTEKAKPRYLIFFNHPFSLLVQPNTDKYIFDWVNKFVSENYQIIGLVDMIEGQHSTYVWKEQLSNYKPISQNLIYIYERRTTIAK